MTFGELLERHEREIFAYVLRLTGNRAEAEDLKASIAYGRSIKAPSTKTHSMRPPFGVVYDPGYSTVTDFARLRGWSTSVPLKSAT